MSRTMFIRLGMGLAALTLVGCSRNNIAGPQALTESQGQIAAGELTEEEVDSRLAEAMTDGGKGLFFVRPAVLNEEGSSRAAKGDAVADDEVIF